jgi:serine protease Do
MANLVASVRREPVDHGLELTRSFESGQGKLMLRSDKSQESNSQALHACDIVEKVNGMPVHTRLDVELALLESRPGELAEISIARGESRINQSLQLKSIGSNVPEATVAKLAWEQIGIRVVPVAVSEVASINEDYRGGLKITEVRPGSPAARNRLMVGDIIVGIMEWQTVNMENLQWILASPNFKQGSASKYYVIRKRQQLMVAMTPDVQRIR